MKPNDRGVMPLVEHEKELARLLAQRKKIDQRRDALQAQITTLRKTIADIERANKANQEAKLSRPWQVKFMRGTPATSGRDIAMLVHYLTAQTTFAAIGRGHGISGGRTQTADVLQHLAQENDNLREALRRLQRWGGVAGGNFSGTVAGAVVDWFDAGGTGPMPELPTFARHEPPNGVLSGARTSLDGA